MANNSDDPGEWRVEDLDPASSSRRNFLGNARKIGTSIAGLIGAGIGTGVTKIFDDTAISATKHQDEILRQQNSGLKRVLGEIKKINLSEESPGKKQQDIEDLINQVLAQKPGQEPQAVSAPVQPRRGSKVQGLG